ncbi:MAG: PilZ domain-containing protein [Candidatus Omnitrophica bacterium]|nr:PilZ domain-containing protein [Candidatus Omnitrophota bacterium]
MAQERRSKRWPVFQEARFRQEGRSNFVDCMLCDISFWGVRISCQEILKNNEIIEMYMNIPDSLHPLIIKAKIIYVQPKQWLFYEYGLAFLDIRQKDREKIYEFIYKNYPSELKKTLLRNGKIYGRGGEEEMLRPAPIEDRRIFARIAVDLYARYLDVKNNKEGYLHVWDISAKGMGVTVREKFKPGTFLEIWVNIPEQKTPIYTRGEVVWTKSDERGRGYRAGINLEKADFMHYPIIKT